MELTKEYNFIWYGQCGTETNQLPDCDEYTLPDGGGNIEQVWQINDAGDAKVWDRTAPPTQPYGDDEFVKLECGHAYYIRLGKNGDTVQTVDIPHAYVSDFADNSHVHDNPLLLGTCEEGDQGPQPQQASIAHGACSSETIHLTANVNDVIANYETCDLQATGATFQAIGLTTSNNVTYELNGSTFSYKIADTANANVGGEEEVTITAIADALYEFGDASNTLVVKLQATVNALPPAINNFVVGNGIVVNNQLQNNNAVQFAPVLANAPAGAKLKFNIVDGNAAAVGNPDEIREIGDDLFGNLFNGWGNGFVVTVELVDSSGASLVPAVTAQHTFNIDRMETTITAGDINLGTRDRDDADFENFANTTPAITNGANPSDWSVTGDVSDATIQKNGSLLQAKFASADFIGSVNGSVTIKTSDLHKFHNQIGQVAENEVSATVTVTGTAEDDLHFAWEGATPSDPVRDDRETDDSIPDNPTAYKFKQDNVNVTASLTGANWQVKIGNNGWGTDVSALNGSTDGTSPNIRFRYNSSAVAVDADGTFTLSGVATNGESDPSDLVVNLRSTITQAIGEATFSGCTSIPAITLEVGDPSDSTNNNESCTLTTTNCSVEDTSDAIGIFDYTITGGVVNYWITNTSSVQSTETETLDVIATADNNFEFTGNAGTETISITLSGTVEAAPIPEDSSIGLGTCPINITQDAGPVATEQTCVLASTNATFGVISETSDGGITYSLAADGTVTYKAETPNASPSTTVTYNHTFEATGTTDNAATSLFAGQSQTDTLQVSLQVTVEAVVVAEDLLWIGFSANGHTEGNSAYTPFYEVEAAEESTTQIPLDNMVQYNSMASFGDGIIPTVGIEGGFQSATMVHFGSIWPFNAANLPDGVTIPDLDDLPILGTANAMYVELVAELDYTSFKFADGTESMLTTLNNWFSSSGASSLVEVLMIANPTQPDVTNLTSLASSAYDSDSLSLKCAGTWNYDESDKTKMVFQYENGDGNQLSFSYTAGATSTGSNISKAGYWTGINAYFANNQAFNTTPAKQPKIIEWYFEKVTAGNKIKLSTGNPAGSHCS